ncbi:MAG: hypothetical protein FJZ57_08030 [Chlamydiae bacterium]|nr:hypothetical protein [Chlamydiota bacterium]
MSTHDHEEKGTRPSRMKHRHVEPVTREIHHHHHYYGKSDKPIHHGRHSSRNVHSKDRHSHTHKESPKENVTTLQSKVTPNKSAKFEAIPKEELLTSSLGALNNYLGHANYLDKAPDADPLADYLKTADADAALGKDAPKQRDQLYHHMYLLFKHKITKEPSIEQSRWEIGRNLFLNQNDLGIFISHKDRARALRLMVLDELKRHYITEETPQEELKNTYSKLPDKFRHKIEGHVWQKAKGEKGIPDDPMLGKKIMNFEIEADDYRIRHAAIEQYIREILTERPRSA